MGQQDCFLSRKWITGEFRGSHLPEHYGQGKDDGLGELYDRVTEMAGCFFAITGKIQVFTTGMAVSRARV